MAKKGKKAGKTEKGAAKKVGKLPKEIGGVKISKPLRRDGEKLIALLKHPLVAEMAAAGLMAFAQGMRGDGDGASKATDPDAARAAARDARKKASKAIDNMGQVAALLGTLLAARAGGDTRH